MTARVSLVVAAAENGVIGANGGLPWRLPDDLRRFRDLTLGKPVVMGRRTWESIGRPLPGRRNVVVSRQDGLTLDGAECVDSVDGALALVSDVPEIMIIGGASLYAATLPVAQRIYLTRVHTEVDGDTVFPEPDPADWREVHRESRRADERHAHDFSFVRLDRAGSR